LLAGVYFVTARAGLSLSPVSGFATLVWPPTGIALAALLLFGWRLWPGIFLGAVLVNIVTGAPLLVALGIGLGNTAEPLVATYLLKRFGFRTKMSRVQDAILLIGCAALLSTLLSATIGTTSLLAGDTIKLAAYPKTWIAWWVGDMLGDLIVAPLLLTWARYRGIKLTFRQVVEVLLVAGLFLILGLAIFDGTITEASSLRSAPYLLFTLLIWAVLRFRAQLVITLNFGLATLTVLAAIHSQGPFLGHTLDERLFASQLFIGITAGTFLLFAAVMSERRQAQIETSALNRQLKKTLARRTAQLRKEKEVERLKDEFVAVASHELKTPITSIKAYARILDDKLLQSKDKQAAHLASRIDSQADKLTRFVEELLDVSRLEAGELILYKSKFDLSKMLKKLIADFQLAAPTHQIIAEISPRQSVVADQGRLEQAVLNLLTNAVKYSPKADKVIIKSGVNHREIIVSVQDFGPGIRAMDRAKIFDRFYRTADTNRRKQATSGIGLGLYITSEIIKQHGGRLWVDSKPGRGSTFSFSLPLS
jgi:signal transduction histidine kinase